MPSSGYSTIPLGYSTVPLGHRPPPPSDERHGGPRTGDDYVDTHGVTPWIQGASITLRGPHVELRALCGKGIPTLSGGVGGSSAVTIPHGKAAVNWEGHPPWQLKLPLIFDGYSRNTHVESDIAALIDMATAEPGDKRPPSIRVSGPLPYHPPIGGWLIEDLDWGDEVIRREGHTVRLRQDVVVTLIEDSEAPLAIRKDKHGEGGQSASVGGIGRTRKYTVRKGDTLQKIAAKLHVKGGWKVLAKLNHIRDPKHLKVGKKIKVPRPSGYLP